MDMDNPGQDGEAQAAPSAAKPAADGERTVNSRELLQAGRELHIEHDGMHYVLRLTRQNKLILTK